MDNSNSIINNDFVFHPNGDPVPGPDDIEATVEEVTQFITSSCDSNNDQPSEPSEFVLNVVDDLITDINVMDEEINDLIHEYSKISITEESHEHLDSFNISLDTERTAATYTELLQTYNVLFQKNEQSLKLVKEREDAFSQLKNYSQYRSY